MTTHAKSNKNAATGPKTTDGKRIAARNATTHGLFARDVVLTHLGECPAAYEALHLELAAELRPASLLEKHYVEKIAAASWRLRRLQRWQAQLFEDTQLSDADALLHLDRVMRHETALHRQIDTAVRLLGRDLPQLAEGRARRAALARFHVSEVHCRQNPSLDRGIADEVRRTLDGLASRPLPAELDAHPEMLDNAPAPHQEAQAHQRICQNEPSTPTPPDPPADPKNRDAGGPCEARNEPNKVVGISAIRKDRQLKRQKNCQNEPDARTSMVSECKGMARHAPTPIFPFREGPAKQGGGFPLPARRQV